METSEAVKKRETEHRYIPLIDTSVEKSCGSCTDATSDTSFQSRTLSLGSESNDGKSSLERSEIPRNTCQDICQILIICFFLLCHEWVTSKNITTSFSANNVLVSLTFFPSIDNEITSLTVITIPDKTSRHPSTIFWIDTVYSHVPNATAINWRHIGQLVTVDENIGNISERLWSFVPCVRQDFFLLSHNLHIMSCANKESVLLSSAKCQWKSRYWVYELLQHNLWYIPWWIVVQHCCEGGVSVPSLQEYPQSASDFQLSHRYWIYVIQILTVFLTKFPWHFCLDFRNGRTFCEWSRTNVTSQTFNTHLHFKMSSLRWERSFSVTSQTLNHSSDVKHDSTSYLFDKWQISTSKIERVSNFNKYLNDASEFCVHFQ